MSEMDRYDSDRPVAPQPAEPPLASTGGIEATEADAAEQQIEVSAAEIADPPAASPADLLADADPADLADQHRVVALDEDDYR